MADILITVGVDQELSYKEFQQGIKNLVNSINRTPPEIKLGFNFDEASIKAVRTQINELNRSILGMKTPKGFNLKTIPGASIAKNTAEINRNTEAKRRSTQSEGELTDSIKKRNDAFLEAVEILNKLNSSESKSSSNAKKSFSGNDLKEYANMLKKVDRLVDNLLTKEEKLRGAQESSSSNEYESIKTYLSLAKNLREKVQTEDISFSEAEKANTLIEALAADSATSIKIAKDNTAQLTLETKEYYNALRSIDRSSKQIGKNKLNWAGAEYSNDSNVRKAYNDYVKLEGVLEELRGKVEGGKLSVKELNTALAEIQATEARVSTILSGSKDASPIIAKDTDRYFKVIKELEKSKAQVDKNKEDWASAADSGNIDVQNAFSKYSALEDRIDSLTIKLNEGKLSINEYNTALAEIQATEARLARTIKPETILKSGTDEFAQAEEKIERLLRKAVTLRDSSTKAKGGRAKDSFNALDKQIIPQIKEFAEALQNNRLAEEKYAEGLDRLSTAVSKHGEKIKAAGENTKSFLGHTKDLASRFASWLTASQLIMYAYNSAKQMVSAAVEIESAMAQIQIVTGSTDSQMETFLTKSISLAKELGRSVTDAASSIETFARLGYNLEDATELSKYANIMANVGNTDIDTATTGITSIIKGYQLNPNDAEHVADVLIEVGQKYAISAEELMAAFQRGGAALHASGTDFEKSAALFAATNASLQNAETTGVMWKTVSARIRGAKTELEEMGESTDDLADGFSKYREEIQALSGVDIMINENTYKDMYDIFVELAEVWDNMEDVSQARVAEILGGTRNTSGVMSTIANIKDAMGAYEAAMNSAGTATEANAIYMDTTEAKVEQLKASFQELSADIISSDFSKFVVDTLRIIIELIDKVVNAISPLGAALAGVGIVKSAKGIKGIIDGIEGVKNLDSILSAITSNWTNFTGATTIAVDAVKGVGASAGVAAPALSTMGASAAALASSLLPIIAMASAVAIGIGLISRAYVSAEEANKRMQNSLGTYEEAKSKLSGISTELETANSRMDELLQKEHLTFVEEGELEKLKEVTEELLIQQDLAERETKKTGRQVAKDAIEAYDKNFTKEISAKETNSYKDSPAKLGRSSMDDTDISAQIALLKKYENAKKKTEKNLKKARKNKNDDQIDQYGEALVKNNEKIEDSKDAIWEQVGALEEYRAALKALPEGELEKISGGKETLAQLDAQISYIYSELDPIKWKQMQFDEILSKDKFEDAEQELIKLAKASNGAGISADMIKEKYPQLAKAIDNAGLSVDDFAEHINASAGITNNAMNTLDGVKDRFTAASEATQVLTSELQQVQSVLGAQMNGKSISVADFNSDALKDYREALEYTNGTMQINIEKSREIAKTKAEEQVATNNANKAIAQGKYIDNARQIEIYRKKIEEANFAKGETAASVQASIDALLAENSTIADMCQQYDLLSLSVQEAVGAYQHWLNAQNASDYGDMADDAVSAIQRIQDTYDSNSDIFRQFGSRKFDAAVEFIIPESVDRDDLSAIESYMASVQEYLNFGENGAIDSLNIDHFLQKSVEAGLMSYSEDEGFKILGGKKMADFAEGLNMSSGLVQAFFDEMQLYDGKFDWGDEVVKTTGDLIVEANEAAEALKKLDENKGFKIKLDYSDLETTDEQIKMLDGTIAEMDELKSRVDVDATDVERANAIIQYCLDQKHLLTQPDVLRVDTSMVEGDLGEAISLLQEFHETQNQLEIQTKIGVDTSLTQEKLDSLLADIQGLSPKIKADLNIDSASAETVKKSISGLGANTLIKVGVAADAIKGYDEKTKKVDVIYNPVKDKLPKSFKPINRDVKYKPKGHKDLPEEFKSITRTVYYVAVGDTSGGKSKKPKKKNKQSLNGTAHSSGTARAGGDWGTAPGGRTLVGELG